MRQIFKAIITIAAKPETYRFVLICLLIVAGSVWVAFYLAKMHIEHDRAERSNCEDDKIMLRNEINEWKALYLGEIKEGTVRTKQLTRKVDSLLTVNHQLTIKK